MDKIGIISSSKYSNKEKARQVFNGVYSNLGKFCVFASGGNTEGPEYWSKRYAQEKEIQYKEYNPSYTGYNMFSAMPREYYDKKYHHSHNFHRYKELVLFCDKIIVFLEKDIEIPAEISYAIKMAEKFEKKVGIIY